MRHETDLLILKARKARHKLIRIFQIPQFLPQFFILFDGFFALGSLGLYDVSQLE
jgi:hypothetical protein